MYDAAARVWNVAPVPATALSSTLPYGYQIGSGAAACPTTPTATYYAELPVRAGFGGVFPTVPLPGFSQQTAQLYMDGSSAMDQMPVRVTWSVRQAPGPSRFSALSYARKAGLPSERNTAPVPFSAAARAAGLPGLVYVPQPLPLRVVNVTQSSRLSKAIRATMSDVLVEGTILSSPETGLASAVNLVSGSHLRYRFTPDVSGVYVVDAVVTDLSPAVRTGGADVPPGEAGEWVNGMSIPFTARCPTIIRHILAAQCTDGLTLNIPAAMRQRSVILDGTTFQYVPLLPLNPATNEWNTSLPAMVTLGPTVVARWTTVSAPASVQPVSVALANAHAPYGASFIPRDTGTYVFLLQVVDTRCPDQERSINVTINVNCKARLANVELQTLSLSQAGFGVPFGGDAVVYRQNSSVIARLAAQYRLQDPSMGANTPVHYTWRIVTAEALKFRQNQGDQAALDAAGIRLPPAPPRAAFSILGFGAGEAGGIGAGAFVFLCVLLYIAYKYCCGSGSNSGKQSCCAWLCCGCAFCLCCGRGRKGDSRALVLSHKNKDMDSNGFSDSQMPLGRGGKSSRALSTGRKQTTMHTMLRAVDADAFDERQRRASEGAFGEPASTFGAFGQTRGAVVSANPMHNLDNYRSSGASAGNGGGSMNSPQSSLRSSTQAVDAGRSSFDANPAFSATRRKTSATMGSILATSPERSNV